MTNEVLLALLIEKLESRLKDIPDTASLRGLRGFQGHKGDDGKDGKDFSLEENKKYFEELAKSFALKFEDLSPDQINSLKGPRGDDGKDGKDFSLEENKKYFEELAYIFALKFENLSSDQINSLKGPKGDSGKDFNFDESKDKIKDFCKEIIASCSEELKLKFSDLTEDQISSLRGPRGREGKDGKDFNFDEHKEFFDGLKLKFSELTEDDISKLKLKFSDLTEDQRASLKLKFSDLTEEEISSLRGPRGQRGRQGDDGKGFELEEHKSYFEELASKFSLKFSDLTPEQISKLRGARGSPGVAGKYVAGRDGRDGLDGLNGLDAPFITDIKLEQTKDEIEFVFEFSDGSFIKTDSIKLPHSNSTYVAYGGGGGGGSGGGSSAVDVGSWADPTLINEVDGIVVPADSIINYYLKSSTGEILSTMTDGAADQIIEFIGTSDTDTVEIADDTNIKLSGPMVLKAYSMLKVKWVDGANKWVEVSRNEII